MTQFSSLGTETLGPFLFSENKKSLQNAKKAKSSRLDQSMFGQFCTLGSCIISDNCRQDLRPLIKQHKFYITHVSGYSA